MKRLEVSGAVRPIYGSLGIKQLRCLMTILDNYMFRPLLAIFRLSLRELHGGSITFRISKNTNYLLAYRHGAVIISNEKQRKARLEKTFDSPTCVVEKIRFIDGLLALERTICLSPLFGSGSHDKRFVSHNREHTNKFIFCRISPFAVN